MIHNHGSVTIHYTARAGNAREMTLPLGPIQNTIAQIILAGCVIQTHKTKIGTGRQAVTIGPYQRATDEKTHRWAVYIGNDKYEFLSPVEAARFFIEHCNRSIARDAVRQYARTH